MARSETNEPGRRIHASVGLARPADPDGYGYISEHHGFGQTDAESGDHAEDLAASMLASSLGLELDPEVAWNERRRIYEHSNLARAGWRLCRPGQGDQKVHADESGRGRGGLR